MTRKFNPSLFHSRNLSSSLSCRKPWTAWTGPHSCRPSRQAFRLFRALPRLYCAGEEFRLDICNANRYLFILNSVLTKTILVSSRSFCILDMGSFCLGSSNFFRYISHWPLNPPTCWKKLDTVRMVAQPQLRNFWRSKTISRKTVGLQLHQIYLTTTGPLGRADLTSEIFTASKNNHLTK